MNLNHVEYTVGALMLFLLCLVAAANGPVPNGAWGP